MLSRLPLLEPHRSSLEKCVYCPKLSRAACPISNVEKNESVTPWGKMSMAYFAGRGDVPINTTHAEPAWACSACYACRERCDHKNEVATVLGDARADLFERGAAPEAAKRVASTFIERTQAVARALDVIEVGPSGKGDNAMILIGCGYVKRAPDVARDAFEAVARMIGKRPKPVRACCGLPLLHAGDRKGFERAAKELASEVRNARELVAVDPGCARALLVEYERAGVVVKKPELFVDLAADFVRRNKGYPTLRARPCGTARFHDPCQLGRGLGRYDEPRAIIEAVTGTAPVEFQRSRTMGECSGAGGLLPVTRPETSRAIADQRIAEHKDLGGGVLVTHCAQSLHRFRSRGEDATDLVSLVARALAP